jgi:hypothetical protein
MATKNQIIRTDETTEVTVQRVVSGMLAKMGEQGIGRFSNRQAIDTVCAAIKVAANPDNSDNKKQAAAIFAAEIALNSVTAGEEMAMAIAELREAVVRGG